MHNQLDEIVMTQLLCHATTTAMLIKWLPCHTTSGGIREK